MPQDFDNDNQSKKTFKQIFLIIGAFIILGLSFFSYYTYSLTQPVDLENSTTYTFVINNGESISKVAQRLQDKGLIKNKQMLVFAVKYKNIDRQIQAGSFELSPSMNIWQIIESLTQGTDDIWVKILEGWRKEQIAQYLDSLGLPEFNKQEFEFLTQDLEGKLYPDSYLVSRNLSTQEIVELMVKTFEIKVLQGLEQDINKSDMQLDDIIILASIVEREARGYKQMQNVAGILMNRLDIGMALEVDASLQYIKGYDETDNTWWPTPLSADKELQSPFNTYSNPNLPPHPICNPGLDAIKAVLNPIETNYLFYLHDPQGEIHYATDYNQHLININKYLQ